MTSAPPLVNAVVDQDANTITVAFTFKMQPWFSTDRCEAVSFTSFLRTILAARLTEADEHAGVESFSYQCWHPGEEQQLGFLPDYTRGYCTGCGEPMVTTDTPPWFAHVVGPNKVLMKTPPSGCDNIDNCTDPDGYAIRFANLLEVDFTKGLA